MLPRQELARPAAAPAIEARFADRSGEEHAVSFDAAGLAEALAAVDAHLAR
jgi:hypothetical protein